MEKTKQNFGFGLLETIITLAIITLAAAILMSAFGSFRAASDLTETHSNIIGIIKDARARTLASNSNSNYGVHFATDRSVLFKGNSYSSSDPNNDVYLLPASTEISAINLTGGAVDTVFTRLNGTTTTSGTISIRSKRNSSTRIITLEPTGVVK